MIGSLIGGGIGVLGSVVGAIGSARKMKQANSLLDAQQAKNQTWYDKEYNTDYTQRADAQAILNKTREMANENRKRARGMAVVAGATDEAVAMENEASNNMVADTMGNINQSADAYKQSVQGQFRATQQQLDQQQYNNKIAEAQNISNAASGVSKAGAGIVGSIFDKK